MKTSPDRKAKPFDTKWWREFVKTTQDLSQTAVFRNCMDKTETRLLRRYVLQIVQSLAAMRTDRYGYRVYVDGKKLDESEMDAIYDSPPCGDETTAQWSKRVFGKQPFGIIINSGEKFNRGLSQHIALKTEPLLHLTGIPTEGIIFTLFIGDYPQTPLGIHKDLKGKSVLHFHLGPSDKTMYTWDTQAYEARVGEKKYNNKEIDKYLPYAHKYPYSEGDLFFMQEDTYHVGRQDGFSIAIACWFYNRSNRFKCE